MSHDTIVYPIFQLRPFCDSRLRFLHVYLSISHFYKKKPFFRKLKKNSLLYEEKSFSFRLAYKWFSFSITFCSSIESYAICCCRCERYALMPSIFHFIVKKILFLFLIFSILLDVSMISALFLLVFNLSWDHCKL